MFKINILSITEDPHVFAVEISAKDLALEPDIHLDGPVKLTSEIYRAGQKVFIRGQFQADIELTCSRCLKSYRSPLMAEIELVAVPAESLNSAVRQSQEGLEDEDVALTTYTGEQLDLTQEIRTALILAIPMKPLCEENCPGLCPDCGERLDVEGHCHCGQAQPKGPFSILEKFKNNPPSAN